MMKSGPTSSRCRSSARSRCAFTLIEVLVTVLIMAVLAGLLLGVVSKVRNAQRGVRCIATLKSLHNAFQQYSTDNTGHLPDPANANKSWEQMLLKYHGGSFACEADQELFPAVGSSYDWRDTGDAQTTLAGRPFASASRPETILVFEAFPGWHRARMMNVARMDGSAVSIDDSACFEDLKRPLSGAAAANRSARRR
jgi:prepilin-type N-terminal cleavage/methylation domain-containing protein